MSVCLNCGHEYERHLFGGMCFYCDCKRAVYETKAPFGVIQPAATANGAKPAKKTRKQNGGKPRRLGAT
ncbi:MAG TPA: hypothetical protein VMR52_01405 [Dehalococcoidia bacterium]|nr:hypothetical protein [Dehalococcoidia bacterium]